MSAEQQLILTGRNSCWGLYEGGLASGWFKIFSLRVFKQNKIFQASFHQKARMFQHKHDICRCSGYWQPPGTSQPAVLGIVGIKAQCLYCSLIVECTHCLREKHDLPKTSDWGSISEAVEDLPNPTDVGGNPGYEILLKTNSHSHLQKMNIAKEKLKMISFSL